MGAVLAGRLRGVARSPAALAGAAAAAALALAAVLGPLLIGPAAARYDLQHLLQDPGPGHLVGTDELGRDLLLRLVAASGLSLGLSLMATLLGATIGILVGGLPSVAPRWAGRLVAGMINIALAFPALLLTLFVAAVAGPGMRSATLAISLALAPIFARLALTLSAGIRNADYIAAARLLGVRPHAILLRHVLPNMAGPLLVTGVMSVSGALIVLSGLSFLGLGVQPPDYDWGVLLSQGLNRIYVSPAPALAPAVAIVLAGLGLNLFGETLAILLGQRQVADAPTRAARTTSLVAPGAPILLPQPKDLLLAQGLRVEVVDPRGATTSIVHGLSFSLARGERVGLVGESGSGKTMTALAVARLLDGRARAQADALWYDGHLLIGPDAISGRKARALLGGTLPVVFQDPLGSFNPLLRVGGQVAEAATEHGGLVWKAALSRAIARMDDVGIEAAAARAHQHPHELSGGMLQRCMIAMALMLRPKLIVADEPTTALDVTVQKQVLALLDGVCAETGAGLLLISHDLAVVASVCSRVLVMYAGRIVEDLPVHLLSTGPSHPYTRALLASTLDLDADRASPLRTLPGRAPRSEETVSGCSFASRCALAGPRCSVDEPPLAPLAPGHRAACWRPHLPADAQP